MRVFYEGKSGGVFECNDATSTQNAFMCSKSAIGLVIGGRLGILAIWAHANREPTWKTLGFSKRGRNECSGDVLHQLFSISNPIIMRNCLPTLNFVGKKITEWDRTTRRWRQRKFGLSGKFVSEKSISHPNWKKPRICQCLRR